MQVNCYLRHCMVSRDLIKQLTVQLPFHMLYAMEALGPMKSLNYTPKANQKSAHEGLWSDKGP